jgi:phospholipid/cholesterol/gamma-HCH transport system substrate-binding protein
MSNRSRNIKVGLFVLAGLFFSGIVIFLIGDERRLFSPSESYRAEFANVMGLKSGAPVQMGGIDIGHVGEVGYSKDPRDTKIYVALEIVKSEAMRIKVDSHVRVATKGLLGDKMIEITQGKAEASLPSGSLVTADVVPDLIQEMSGAGMKAIGALDDVKKVTSSLADDKLQRDLHESVASLNNVLKQVSEGDGYPHRLLTDKGEAERISHTLASLDRVAQEATAALADVRQISDRIKAGPGFAHDVIFGDGPAKQIEQFGDAAHEVAATLKGMRDGDGLMHDAIYGGKGEGAETMKNVAALTGDLRVIVANIRAGKGTMGALLVDPSIYEDMKMVLGNVQRNDVLRSLVRYSIKQDEKKPAVEVGKGVSSPTTASP